MHLPPPPSPLPSPPQKKNPNKIAKNVHFVTLWLIYENLVINYLPMFYICLQYDEVCICGHLGTVEFNVRTPLRAKKIR